MVQLRTPLERAQANNRGATELEVRVHLASTACMKASADAVAGERRHEGARAKHVEACAQYDAVDVRLKVVTQKVDEAKARVDKTSATTSTGKSARSTLETLKKDLEKLKAQKTALFRARAEANVKKREAKEAWNVAQTALKDAGKAYDAVCGKRNGAGSGEHCPVCEHPHTRSNGQPGGGLTQFQCRCKSFTCRNCPLCKDDPSKSKEEEDMKACTCVFCR